jgi:hypothetical protein
MSRKRIAPLCRETMGFRSKPESLRLAPVPGEIFGSASVFDSIGRELASPPSGEPRVRAENWCFAVVFGAKRAPPDAERRLLAERRPLGRSDWRRSRPGHARDDLALVPPEVAAHDGSHARRATGRPRSPSDGPPAADDGSRNPSWAIRAFVALKARSGPRPVDDCADSQENGLSRRRCGKTMPRRTFLKAHWGDRRGGLFQRRSSHGRRFVRYLGCS